MTATSSNGSTGSTSGASLAYRLNDVFLPRTGSHQPYGLDTLATMYRKYHVYGVKIQLTAIVRTATSSTPVFPLILVRPGGATFSIGALALAANVVGEKPLGRVNLLMPASARCAMDVTMNFQISTIEGLTGPEYNANESYRALVGASPDIVPTLEIANSSQATVGAALDWRVRITYDVEFYERVLLAQS